MVWLNLDLVSYKYARKIAEPLYTYTIKWQLWELMDCIKDTSMNNANKSIKRNQYFNRYMVLTIITLCEYLFANILLLKNK